MKHPTKKKLSASVLSLMLVATVPAGAQIHYNAEEEIKAADMGVERVAKNFLPPYISMAKSDDEQRWVQIDLGSEHDIEGIKVLPPSQVWGQASFGFPNRFDIKVSNDSTFRQYVVYEDQSAVDDFPAPGTRVLSFFNACVKGRYVRFTATHLRFARLVLTKIMVFSGGKDVAEGCRVTESNPSPTSNPAVLTRKARPDGEFVVTDNPQNVIPQCQWHPVTKALSTPLHGVTLGQGLLKKVIDNNVDYLLNAFSYEETVRNFKLKAGLPVAEFNPTFDFMWMRQLPGSCVGRFLMGAGNTLRWAENRRLRSEMDAIVNLIDSCRESDGYLLAFPRHMMFEGERGAYCRSWVTRGLIDAGAGGSTKALSLLRNFGDWFNSSPFLPEMMKRCKQGVQGMIPLTLTYFSPVGKAEDIYTAQRYFQLNHWMKQLALRDPKAIYEFPYDRPHNYLVTTLEAYMDLYLATGQKQYLEAVKGGWQLFHDNWEHIGGSLAINEGEFVYAPKSHWLTKDTGELCGNAFWVKLNQRFHHLYPNEEKYTGEIEKSLFNVIIPNQNGNKSIRYFARLTGHKCEPAVAQNTCCEGQGTRIFGSLPEFVWSTAKNALYVDLYAPSTIICRMDGHKVQATMTTDYPYATKVTVKINNAGRGALKQLCLRIPQWASEEVCVSVNGQTIAQGKPGSYLTMERKWRNGDKVEYEIPTRITVIPYEGIDPAFTNSHCAVLYNGIMLATVNGKNEAMTQFPFSPDELPKRMKAVSGKPLHYTVEGMEGVELMPYFEIEEQNFTCFPAFSK